MRLLPSAEAARRGLEGENKAQRLVVGQTKWPIGEGGCREIGKKAAFLECSLGETFFLVLRCWLAEALEQWKLLYIRD